MAWLEVKALRRMENGLEVVSNLSFTMQQGEKLAIMGETGSGKSSILKMIAGLMQPDSGKMIFRNQKVEGPMERLIPGQPGIAYLSQYSELRPNFYIHEILEYANELTPKEAEHVYKLCEISHLLYRKTTQLSGGEKQRVALARLLTSKPSLLLLDEPFSHLDLPHKQTIKQVIAKASTELGFTSILVSHDPVDVLSWADRILILKNGKVIEEGTPEMLYAQPNLGYTANLLGLGNLLDASMAAKITAPPANDWVKGWYLLRPEQVIADGVAKLGIPAEIVNVQFTGSYFTIQLRANNQLILAFSQTDKFIVGQKVWIFTQRDKLQKIKV